MDEKSTRRKLLHNKDFILLFLGGFVSRIGSKVHYVAMTWFVLKLTGSGTAAGTVLLLATLPGAILGPVGGVIADRINRKLIIVSMDTVRGLIVIWLSWTVYNGTAGFYHICIATFLVALSGTFFNPAVTASIPNIVEKHNLQKANSLEHLSFQGTSIIGAATGGILIAIFGVAGVFLIDGISYLISAFSELFINIPPVKREEQSGDNGELSKFTILYNDLREGARYLYSNKPLFTLFSISIIINFLFAGAMAVGIPYVFKEVLQVNSKLFGLAQSFFPAGAILGAVIMNFLPPVKNFFRTLFTGITFQTILLAAIGLPISPFMVDKYPVISLFILMAVILILFGAFNAYTNIPINTMLQRLIDDRVRGRVFGLLATLNMGLVPVSMWAAGCLLDAFPAYLLFVGAGGIMVGVLAYSVSLPTLKPLKNEVYIDKRENPAEYSAGV
ncbi:MFS transporter [Halothermothrix orenii]|uniref:Major facilitator superfamily MFS_1 n=1 Tax=Halothermothrix orenii (strain H 168 / OCM 544 / DSM 9562) TaxID=373903 RepID=B8CZF3_HALOH|nr:MFS transporter [Halothermothrix orenii]ACL70672.1 major facilitator superfamily MFS_1 [Halothermothrix orenii H 168]